MRYKSFLKLDVWLLCRRMPTFRKSSVPVQVILQMSGLSPTTRISPSGGIKHQNQVKVIFQDATGNLIVAACFHCCLWFPLVSSMASPMSLVHPSTGKEHAVSRQCSKMSLRIMTAQRKTGRRRLEKYAYNIYIYILYIYNYIYIYQTCPGLLIHTLGTAMTIVFSTAQHCIWWLDACWSQFTLKISDNLHQFQWKWKPGPLLLIPLLFLLLNLLW